MIRYEGEINTEITITHKELLEKNAIFGKDIFSIKIDYEYDECGILLEDRYDYITMIISLAKALKIEILPCFFVVKGGKKLFIPKTSFDNMTVGLRHDQKPSLEAQKIICFLIMTAVGKILSSSILFCNDNCQYYFNPCGVLWNAKNPECDSLINQAFHSINFKEISKSFISRGDPHILTIEINLFCHNLSESCKSDKAYVLENFSRSFRSFIMNNIL